MRSFNTAGPCDPRKHYMLAASPRLPDAVRLIEDESYFVVHAPRQTGKTTGLRALAHELTASGRYAAVYFSCEAAEPAGEDYVAVNAAILSAIRSAAESDLPPDLHPPAWPASAMLTVLHDALRDWSRACPRPLVLFFDEIDALRGDSLRSVLRQLRSGFPNRPESFPHALVLCGLRDVRDYKDLDQHEGRLGTSSPFNVKVASVRVPDFTAEDVRNLLLQHTAATGQPFTEDALAAVFELTQGQPWLVNALAKEVVERLASDGAPITAERIDRAKEVLILRRDTHLDSLVDKLHEPRVRRILEPLLAGGQLLTADSFDDDFTYVRDLGLVAANPPIRVSNPIYREVIVRVLSRAVQYGVTHAPAAFVLPDGRLDFPALLDAFADFWREHGAVLTGSMSYHEVAPQLVLMAFFQRLVNGGGFIDREYGVGRGRIDLLIRWPWPGGLQREAVELKVWAEGRPDPLERGLKQLDEYLTRFTLDQGTLVIFDRRAGQPDPEARTRFEAAVTPGGRAVRVLRG